MMPPSVRWVPTAATESVASARLRCYRPAAALAGAGWDSAVVRGRRPVRADVVVFQKAYGERALGLAARLRRRGTFVVLDLCDNHLHNPGGDPALSARADRLRRMIGLADIVTASTPQLASLVDHPAVHVVDDAIEVTRPVRAPASGAGRNVVWFGNAGSEREGFGMHDLGAIVPSLESLARHATFELTVLSNSERAFHRYVGQASFVATYEPWTADRADHLLSTADVALLPVTANPITRCKTSNRLAIALQYGLAVVADRIPSYEEFAPYLRFADWEKNVAAYLADEELRAVDVTGGQRYIAHRFPDDHLVGQWTDVLMSARAQC